jgi:cobalt transporter subunit CbtB
MRMLAPLSVSPVQTPSCAEARSSRAAAAVTGLAGIALLWVVGFAEVEVLHNIAHDTRHSNVLPCH